MGINNTGGLYPFEKGNEYTITKLKRRDKPEETFKATFLRRQIIPITGFSSSSFDPFGEVNVTVNVFRENPRRARYIAEISRRVPVLEEITCGIITGEAPPYDKLWQSNSQHIIVEDKNGDRVEALTEPVEVFIKHGKYIIQVGRDWNTFPRGIYYGSKDMQVSGTAGDAFAVDGYKYKCHRFLDPDKGKNHWVAERETSKGIQFDLLAKDDEDYYWIEHENVRIGDY